MIEYSQISALPESYLKEKIKEYLLEDMPNGDITTNPLISGSKNIVAYIQAQEDIIVAGLEIIKFFFNSSFEIELKKKDGDTAKKDELLATIKGRGGEILTKEISLLNLLQRLSGIATQTAKYVEIAKPHNVKILDTRKTMPGMRLFDKYAVRVGGGHNHRLDLSSGIMIKDNHIALAGSVKDAVEQIRSFVKTQPIELEVDTFEQIYEGLDAGVEGFLLDNMNKTKTIQAVKIIRNAPKGDKIFIESSGGITLSNLNKYVTTGINAISIGALTHSVRNVDMHMEFV
ncbi:MAG: carboxylating nicotinate-nucleotide diphosphorylase [Candidatus Kapabacteria bacterium]|nr:carboxylating nicotinate-nucleotide diphosphorylase [Candidatus Kapabacteria bacterium]